MLKRSYQKAGPNLRLGLASIVIRLTTMGLSLGSTMLTYKVLSASDFTLFNLFLFWMALGSAIASPVNRSFWAGDAKSFFSESVLATMVIVGCTIAIGIGSTNIGNPSSPSTIVALAAVGCLFGWGRVFERFGYGKVLIDGNFARALAISLIFALCDAGVVAAMWVGGTQSLILRVVGTPVIFIAILFATSYRYLVVRVARRVGNIGDYIAHIKTRMVSVTAIQVLLLTGIAAVASMGDRLILSHLSLGNNQLTADYLLVLSYAIALQSLLTFFFDLSRKYIYFNNEWQPRAANHMVLMLFSVLAITVAAMAVYPVAVALEILPQSITFILWAGLLCRALAFLIVNLLNTDHFQSGRIWPMFWPNLLLLLVSLACLVVLRSTGSQALAGSGLMVAAVVVGLVLAAQFFRRVKE